MHTTRYTVETIRSGQSRPYGDTIEECCITVESTQYGKDGLHPWVLHGDKQRDWAKQLVKTLFRSFRERGDDDGLVERSMAAHFHPTLNQLSIELESGKIRAVIVTPFTD